MNNRPGQQMGFAMPPFGKTAKIIVAVNMALWFVMVACVYWAPETAQSIADLAYLNPDRVLDGYVYQLATYMFFHDVGSPFHVLMNMLLVYFFVGQIEEKWGVAKTLLFALGAGIAGGLAAFGYHFLSGLWGAPTTVTLGFSGAAMAFLTLFCLEKPNAQILLLVFPMKAKHLLMLSIGLDLLAFIAPGGSVSFPAHMGGVLFAAAMLGGGPFERILLQMRYKKIKKELDKRKGAGENVVKGPWIH